MVAPFSLEHAVGSLQSGLRSGLGALRRWFAQLGSAAPVGAPGAYALLAGVDHRDD